MTLANTLRDRPRTIARRVQHHSEPAVDSKRRGFLDARAGCEQAVDVERSSRLAIHEKDAALSDRENGDRIDRLALESEPAPHVRAESPPNEARFGRTAWLDQQRR